MKENTLWYNKPAEVWNDAMPLGNGKLGMMVFGGVNVERIQLNEETIWSGWEYPVFDSPKTYEHLDEMRQLIFEGKYKEAQELCNKYMVCRAEGHHEVFGSFGSYQTAGDLYITVPFESDAGYRRELKLDEGYAKVEYDGAMREYFVSYNYNTAVIKLTGGAKEAELKFERDNCSVIHDDNEIIVVGFLPLKFAVLIRHEIIDDSKYIYITAATAYKTDRDPLDVCKETLDKAMEAGYEALRNDTKDYFGSMLGRCGITFPESGSKADVPTDERIANPEGDIGLAELYFNFGRYLLVGSSRGRLPANLQGIWCKDYKAPWSADFHININIQMNYWFAETCNLPELAEPFFDLIRNIAKFGKNTAHDLYRCSGWVSHTFTNPWGYTSLGCNPVYGAFATSGAWCLRHVKERWLYSGDKEILRDFYDIIKGSAEFFSDYLVKDPRTGHLVTVPASSPENSFTAPDGTRANVCAGPTMDISIIRELFEFYIEATNELGVDADFARKIEAVKAELPPLSIGKHGQIMEWQEDFDEPEPGHRHMSHLYGL
nr:glycoside hydrolase family 95 protein [Clostridia bacterium]